MKYLLIVFSLIFSCATYAESWDSLSGTQRRALADHEAGWDKLPQERQKTLVLGASRWIEMGGDQRAAMRDRYSQWQGLDGKKRQQLMQRWQDFRQLTPLQQRRMRDGLRQFKKLPTDKRRALRQQFQRRDSKDRARALQRMKRNAQRAPKNRAPRTERR